MPRPEKPFPGAAPAVGSTSARGSGGGKRTGRTRSTRRTRRTRRRRTRRTRTPPRALDSQEEAGIAHEVVQGDMPRSKRNRKISLTQTRSKGRALKTELVDKVRDAVDEFEHAYIFSFDNMRSNLFKGMRQQLKKSRVFLGKNKVMQLALGKSKKDEYREDTARLGRQLRGQRGLLFTNEGPEVISPLLENFSSEDYARGGMIAPKTIVLEAGALPTMIHSMVEPLRKLGLQVTLKRGVVTLDRDTTICAIGEEISPTAARLLKLFEYKLAIFRISLVSHWSDGDYTNFEPDEDDE